MPSSPSPSSFSVLGVIELIIFVYKNGKMRNLVEHSYLHVTAPPNYFSLNVFTGMIMY